MRFACRHLTAILARAGTPANHKRVYWLYCKEGLAMRIRQRRRTGWSGATITEMQTSMSVNEGYQIRFRILSARFIFIQLVPCSEKMRPLRPFSRIAPFTLLPHGIVAETSLDGTLSLPWLSMAVA